MQIEVMGNKVSLDPKKVMISKKAINAFIETFRRSADNVGLRSLYCTFLIQLYVKSAALLEALEKEDGGIVKILDEDKNTPQ